MLVFAAALLTGCDFFRSIVGKPTSKDIERMRQEELAKARKQREQDSIDRINALKLQEAMAKEKEGYLDESAGRYHVVIGSFRVSDNAEKMYSLLEREGYKPFKFKFNNGFEAVSVAAFDNYRDALDQMYKVMEFQYCPDDIWVYDIRQNLHEKYQGQNQQ